MDTIFALSSGSPPAAIAVVRVSGPAARGALEALAGRVPSPRRASAAELRMDGELLDRALVLWLPGPGTATGEDIAEFHLHGGRAVVRAVEAALGTLPGLRRATAGEFTRRAFANGAIDLAEAEGLADLLEAETELQRRAAMVSAGGRLSRQVEDWRERVLALSAQVEAALDFSDEDDAAELPPGFETGWVTVATELDQWLTRQRAEKLREGFRVVLAGPPNAGKSSLFNALVESEAAITAPTPGTTRDIIERSVAIEGVPFTFVDTAGLRERGGDAIEAIGIGRAQDELRRADLVLWLGPEGAGPAGAWEIAPKADLSDFVPKGSESIAVSAASGEGIDALKRALTQVAAQAMPARGEVALNERQHDLLGDARDALAQREEADLLLVAERLRLARSAFDRLVGRASTEDMLDALFGRFCIGK